MATDHSKFQRFVILDYGSQSPQLIARRIREQQVFSEIIRFDTPAAKLRENMPQGTPEIAALERPHDDGIAVDLVTRRTIRR